MNKETIRPLLVESLARLESREEEARIAAIAAPEYLQWQKAAELQEAWAEARLKRAQAELQLWLADRQWEREEAEQLAMARDKVNPPAVLKTTKL